MVAVNSNTLPTHVAIIMDGNGRWAKKRLLPRALGHREGVQTTRKVIEYCARAEIPYLTLFAFSSENWQRPKTEVSSLMSLFLSSLDEEAEKLKENGVRLRFIGDRTRFPEKLRAKIDETERLTQDNERLHLTIAANYGGRWDIAQAAKKAAQRIVDAKESINELTEARIADCLATGDLPEPDLFIRTGGEQRISNFLLWQLAYTELYFTQVLWPDFDIQHMESALQHFSSRDRRFGRTQDQVEGGADA